VRSRKKGKNQTVARFVACPACDRHFRASESVCPFCEFGPVRCTAPPPTRWVLGVSLATLVAGPLVACDKGTSQDGDSAKQPASDGGKADGSTPNESDGANGDDAASGGEATEPQKTIYGGPREMTGGPEDDEGDAPDPEQRAEPRKTIYGGPRMMSGGSPDGDDSVDGPSSEKTRPPPIYGAPPPDSTPKPEGPSK